MVAPEPAVQYVYGAGAVNNTPCVLPRAVQKMSFTDTKFSSHCWNVFPLPLLLPKWSSLLFIKQQDSVMKTSVLRAAAEEPVPGATPCVVIHIFSLSYSPWKRQGDHQLGDQVTPLFYFPQPLKPKREDFQCRHWAFHIMSIRLWRMWLNLPSQFGSIHTGKDGVLTCTGV